jgi:AraC-like DNA-binding protein
VGVVVNTETVPPAERFALWADASPRVFEPLVVTRAGEEPFRGRVWRHPLGPLTLFRVQADPSAVRRTPATIRASDPERVQVALLLRGRCAVAQEERTSLLTHGDFSSWASSRPYVVEAQTPFELLVTYCPEIMLRPHSDRVFGRTALAVPGGVGMGRLLRRFLLELTGELHEGSLAGAEGDVAEALLDLLRGLYGVRVAPQEALERAPDVLRAQIRTFMDTNLGDPRLAPEGIARSHFISRSYLDKLFESQGAGVRETIREKRLDRCRRDLQDPALAALSILDIASRWGFVSAAHFSRTFRAAYGMAPRELRRAASGQA